MAEMEKEYMLQTRKNDEELKKVADGLAAKTPDQKIRVTKMDSLRSQPRSSASCRFFVVFSYNSSHSSQLHTYDASPHRHCYSCHCLLSCHNVERIVRPPRRLLHRRFVNAIR